MIVASHFIINTLLQRGVLRGAETQNRFNFNGFYALSKTAEAVRTTPPHSYTPLKQGVNERNPLRIARFLIFFAVTLLSRQSMADETDGVAFFEAKVRPLLVERCIE